MCSVQRCVWFAIFFFLFSSFWCRQLVFTKRQRMEYITLSTHGYTKHHASYRFETWKLCKLVFHLTDDDEFLFFLLFANAHNVVRMTLGWTATLKTMWFNGANACFIGFNIFSRVTVNRAERERERNRKQKSCDPGRVIDFKWFNISGCVCVWIHRRWHDGKTEKHISFFAFQVTFDLYRKPLQPKAFRRHLCFTSCEKFIHCRSPLSHFLFFFLSFRLRPLNETKEPRSLNLLSIRGLPLLLHHHHPCVCVCVCVLDCCW